MKVYRYIHEWNCEGKALFFHTFPMIHIGKPQYYSEISRMLDGMNHIFIEGVSFKKKSEIGSYKKVAAILEMTTQHESLHFPEDITVNNIDMPALRFHSEIKRLPFSDKVKLAFIGIILSTVSNRQAEKILNHLIHAFAYKEESKHTLVNPENHYAWKHKEKSKLDLLIENKRNEVITEYIGRYITENSDRPYRMDIAIVFGDAHMPYIYEKLKEYGFSWKLEKTVEVF